MVGLNSGLEVKRAVRLMLTRSCVAAGQEAIGGVTIHAFVVRFQSKSLLEGEATSSECGNSVNGRGFDGCGVGPEV